MPDSTPQKNDIFHHWKFQRMYNRSFKSLAKEKCEIIK